MDKFDIGIIGGGPAGYHAAIRGAQKGAKVVIFEKDVVGGTCLNRGCIPTKTYLKTAEYIKHIEEAPLRGILINEKPSVNLGKVVDYKNGVVKTLTMGVAALLRSNGVTVVNGEASLSGTNQIKCGENLYEVDKIILCGGSKVGRLPIEGIDHPCVLDSDKILDLRELPERLCVVGGGVIGCEMATAFSKFGVKVTIVEMADRILPMFDEDISNIILQSLKGAGVEVLTSRKVTNISDNNGKPVVETDKEKVEIDKVLVSIGRSADLSCLGSLASKINQNRGKVVVDDFMRTNIPNIYACGDINGRLMLAHSAYKMADVAIDNCLGKNIPCDLRFTPSCLYTMPEAASVGLTEKQAKEKYANVKVGKFNFSGNGRALASGEREGFVKVIAEEKYGEILGVHIVGGMATEMIAEATALIAEEITIDEVAHKIIHAHPSYSEAFLEACEDVRGMSVHNMKKKK